MNTGLTLRTAHITGGIAAVQVGATLLFDSDPESEERETHIKARALLETLFFSGQPCRNRRLRRPPRSPVPPPFPGPAGPETAASGAGAAGRPPGLVCAYPRRSFSGSSAQRSRQVRAGFPAPRCSTQLSTQPGRAVARARTAVGLRVRRAAVRTRRAEAAGVRRVPRAAGHGGARRGRAHGAARARSTGNKGEVRVRAGSAALFAELPEQFTAARYFRFLLADRGPGEGPGSR